MIKPEVSKAASMIHYDCGCIAEYQYIGAFAHIPEFHIIPCYTHTNDRQVVERWAEFDWEQITSNVHFRGIPK